MKHERYWGLVGMLMLLLVACNSATPTGATSEEGGVAVTVSAAFSDSVTQTVSQGVPSGVQSVEVIVYRSGNRVGSAQLTPANPSASLSLKPGFTYRFTSSAKKGGVEVAWGDVSQDIGSNTKLTLALRTVGKAAAFGTPTYSPSAKRLNVPLLVTAPDRSPVPLADYGDPTYTVSGGKLDSGSKLGAAITPDSPSGKVRIAATVKVSGTAHTEVTLNAATIELTPSSLPQPGAGSLTINATLINWPKTAGYTGVAPEAFFATTKIAGGSLNPATGLMNIALPGGEGLGALGLLTKGGCTAQDGSGPVRTATAFLQLRSQKGETATVFYGDEAARQNGGGGPFTSSAFFLRFAEKASNCSSGEGDFFHYQLGAGWNYVEEQSTPGKLLVFDPTQPPYNTWAWGTQVRDFALALSALRTVPVAGQPDTPTVGAQFSYRVKVDFKSGYVNPIFSRDGQTARVSGSLQLPSGKMPSQNSGSSAPFPGGQGCNWSYDGSGKVSFECTYFLNFPPTSADFSVPMGTLTNPNPLTGSARVEEFVDANPADNTATLTFTPGPALNLPPVPVGVGADIIPPVVKIDVAVASPVTPYKVGQEINVTGTATDNVGVTETDLYQGAEFIVGEVFSLNPAKSQPLQILSFTPRFAGTYKLTVIARDAAGNEGSDSVTVTVLPAQ